MSAPIDLLAPPAHGADRRDRLATRRPVGTFVALVTTVALVLVALGLTGIMAPRLETLGWRDGAPAPGERVWTVEIHNGGMAPVEVEAATWPVHGLDGAELLVGRPGRPGLDAGGTRADATPFAPFTLGGGETRLVMLRGSLRCPPGTTDTELTLETLTLGVRSAIGLRRSIDVGSGPYGAGPFGAGAFGAGPGNGPRFEPCP